MSDRYSGFISHIKEKTDGEVILLDTKDVTIDKKVKEYCCENVCGQYGKNYTCPPYAIDIEKFESKLAFYKKVVCISETTSFDANENFLDSVRRASKLNSFVIGLEKEAQFYGFTNCLALTAGPCIICNPCKALTGDPCPYPELVRSSAEALGIDVFTTCETAGIEMVVPEGMIKWVVFLLV